MIKTFVIFSCLISSAWSHAQEYGALIGVHQTEAELGAASGSSVKGKMGFKAGLAMAFGLADQMRFRTGAIYNQRHFESSNGSQAGETKYNFDYVDVPANLQFNFNDKVSVFGGMIIGVNINDDVKYPTGVTAADPDIEKMIPLLNAGVNLLFDDMIGFDFYIERGMGDIADGLKNYSTFGGNFLYWY